MPELIRLLPEGSAVVAVIIVVLLFLKQQREQERRLEGITAAFNERIKEVTKGFQDQVDRLTTQIFKYEEDNQKKMQQLFDGFMGVAKETITAVVELRGAVESLTKRFDKINVDKPKQIRSEDK
jgi:uncharacterized coiled-coil protein SlyX